MADYSTRSFVARQKDAHWVSGGRPQFRYRYVGVEDATDGDITVMFVKADQPCNGPMGYHSHRLQFQFGIITSGSAKVYLEDIGEIELVVGDAWYQPSGVKHELLEYSEDFEMLEIALPAVFSTLPEAR